jgi:hypothetical protein
MKNKHSFHQLCTIFLLVLLAGFHHTFAQCTYTYPNTAGWTIGGSGYTIGPASFNFNSTPCGAGYNFATMPTPCALNNSCWCADIDFVYTARTAVGVAHSLLSFTSNTLNSWNTGPTFAISNNDVIEAYISCPANGPAGSERIYGQSKLGTTWSAASTGIAVTPGNTYYIRLQRLSPTQGLISVFSNSARTTHVAGSPQCFTINSSVGSLPILQHGAIPQGSSARKLTGTLSNLALNPVTPGILGMPSPLCGRSTTLNLCVNQVCGANNYTWSGPPGFTINSGQGSSCISASVVVGTSGTITCVTSFPGAPACANITQTITIVYPVPTITASASPSFICGSGSTTLTASGATSYNWLPPISSTSASVVVSPAVTTTYTVTGTSASGCIDTAVITVPVYPAVTANAGLNDTTCCGTIYYLGGLSGSASGGTPPYSYSWSPTTNFIGCTNCANPPVMSCSGSSVTITYTLTVTDANGCTGTSTVSVSYNYCRLANPNASQASGAAIEDDMSITPNPTNGNFVIAFPNAIAHDVQIVNLLGEVVYSKTADAGTSLSIDLSVQPKGIYLVKCREGDRVYVQQIIIQ